MWPFRMDTGNPIALTVALTSFRKVMSYSASILPTSNRAWFSKCAYKSRPATLFPIDFSR
eukprot:692845-Rhodomonas_salina.1